MNAIDLFDSRKFSNKLDAAMAVIGRKRPAPTDEEKAEAFQPVLDYILAQGGTALIESPRTATEEAAYQEEAKVAAQDNFRGLDERAKEMLGIIEKKGKDSTQPFTVVLGRDGSYPITKLPEYLERYQLPYRIVPQDDGSGWYLDFNARQWVVKLAKVA